VAAGIALLLAGCAAEPAPAPSSPPAGGTTVVVDVDVDFGGPDGVLLDVCLPEDPEPGAPTIFSVHGGGWRGGDKAGSQWRDACVWLAGQGFVVFQPNYRLAPEHPFPAAIRDLEAALAWIREDTQVARFGHDPERMAAFGDSAGGNLVALLATRNDASDRADSSDRSDLSDRADPSDRSDGSDPFDAVVELSAPLDLTREGIAYGDLDESFQDVQLEYLGCESYADCPIAQEASPLYAVDAGDPPFFVVASTDDFIPVEQAEEFVGRLEDASVEVVFVPIDGGEHALGLLDEDLKARIVRWLRDRLGA
jgi:acetyl esterase/lipase